MRKLCWKLFFFERRILIAFFGFWRFCGLDFGSPRVSQEPIKNWKNHVWNGFGACFVFLIDFGSDFGAILMEFGTFWEPKMESQVDFWKIFHEAFFFRVRFGIDFGWLLGSWKSEIPRKTTVFSMGFINFNKTDVFRESAQKLNFGSVIRCQNHEQWRKWCGKMRFLLTSQF